MITFIDFFAGLQFALRTGSKGAAAGGKAADAVLGGFRRGMELAGHRCIGFCEADKFAIASYMSMHLMDTEERAYISALPERKRAAEAGKEEYRHGEWFAEDVRQVSAGDIPKADCWCLGFPCVDISVAGRQLGFRGNRSSLFFQIVRLIGELEEKDRPTYLFIENVKNLLSVNGGTDFLRLLIALDESGYDAGWQVFNSSIYVPQNRERIFIVGHLRGRCAGEVFPIAGTNGENPILQVPAKRAGTTRLLGNFMPTKTRENPNQGRIYDPDGIAPCLNRMEGGGREPHIAVPVLTPNRAEKRQNGRRFKEDGEPMFTLTGQDRHGVMLQVKEATKAGYADAGIGDSVNLSMPGSKTRRGRVGKGIANTLDTSCSQGVVVPVPPDGAEARETAQSPCVAATLSDGSVVYAVWNEKYGCFVAIRKLTPRECFRLQGWEDVYFERAALVNSNSQLYKQAGNGVTVPVVRAIAERLGELEKKELIVDEPNEEFI